MKRWIILAVKQMDMNVKMFLSNLSLVGLG